ncbi:MAG TPA: GIY-YIG nuclease family protein [Thermomicrobiales bacterium]|nr:GIY-YIG nuclease family protein [Thermomicrobiales bacterium]
MYTGVTNDLQQRVWEHKNGVNTDGFTSGYTLTRLVYFAEFPWFDDAIAYEKQIKGRLRWWKMGLVEERNPRWNDLAWDWFQE